MERSRHDRPTSCPAPRGVTLMSILNDTWASQLSSCEELDFSISSTCDL